VARTRVLFSGVAETDDELEGKSCHEGPLRARCGQSPAKHRRGSH
jgi:hypothetical protein